MIKKLIERYNVYHFENKDYYDISSFANYDDGFVLKLSFDSKKLFTDNHVLLKTPGFELKYRKKSINNKDEFTQSETSDRVWLHENNGYVELLEMKMNFICPYTNLDREMIVELVLNKFSLENKVLYFVYSVTEMFWVYDNEKVNSNNPYGNVKIYDCDLIISELIKECAISDISTLVCTVKENIVNKNMAYYSPRGYNTWIGDVVNFYKDGVYHIICFRDRHHHSSRWGGGAHTMHQITTKDFKTWIEHDEIIKLDEQWKTVGTGTMFYHNGKYYFTHGWHTSRMIPVEKTSRSMFEEPYTDDTFVSISYDEIKKNNLYPSGATYLVSDDGINFTPSNVQFHIAENPSVFVRDDNMLIMYAGYGSDGCWIADNINGPWKKIGNLEMASGQMNPSTECPSMFEHNGYKYLIAGRTGFWMTKKDSEEFYDSAIKGFDVYDGLFVPMATKDDKNRIIYSGWLNGYGWGSLMIHRELFQDDNGRLYMRWLSDLVPTVDEIIEVDSLDIENRKSYYFEALARCDIDGKIGIIFSGNKKSVLYLDAKEEIIQISNINENSSFPDLIPPAYQYVRDGKYIHEIADIHYNSHNFSIGRADNLVGQYKIKVMIYYEEKFDSYVLDAEIGGKRTIISNRTEELFSKISWNLENASLDIVKLYKINE
jgi:hypothetical protein